MNYLFISGFLTKTVSLFANNINLTNTTMKHVYSFTNRVVKSFRALALMAFVLLGTANALGDTYTLVTSAPADWSGDYLIVSGTSALSGGTSSWGTIETVTVSGNDITTTKNIAVTISPGGSSGSYYIYQNSNSTYLAEVTSNTFSTATTASTSTEWVISLNSGNAQIGCHSATTRLLRLNGTSGFRCYTSATGTLPKLYKKQVASCTTNATVSTGAESSVTTSSATLTCSGGITDFGANCTISEYGFVYGTSANPTTSNTKAQVGTTYVTPSTSFNTGISSLAASTLYYVRPYAINGNGTAYGTQFSFTTLSPSCSALGTTTVTPTAGNTQVSLAWTAVANASSYTLIWNGGAAETNVTSPITKTGLTNGTSYSYSIMAVGNGTTYCATNTAATGNVTPNCTSISPTITYGAYSVLVGNTIAAPTIGGNTGSGTVTYSSSNTGVLTVNSSTGVVTGVASGTATVTASVASSGNYCSGSIVSSTITVNIPAYTVTFNAGTGSCGTASLTEASGGAGVTLPTALPSGGCAAESPAWVFAGWATASQTETTSAPTLYTSGSTYNPSANVTLYAVYSKTTGGGSTDATLTNAEIKDGTANGSYADITVSSASGTWGGKAIRNTTTGFIQINKNASNYYFGSPTFAGGITSVTINTNNSTVSGRTFYLCSSNGTAQPTSGDLGQGSIPAANGSATITVTGAPTSFYIYSNGAAYIASVTVTYGSGTTTYNSNPNCCTAPSTALSLSATSPLTLSGANVSTAITVTGGNGGTVNYTVDPSSTGSMSGNTFTATATGTYTITGTQALNGSTCGGSDDVTIVVNPAVTYSVSSTLTGCTVSPALPATVDPSTPGIMVTVTPNSCYTLPASISVTMGGTPLTLNTDYLWDTSGADNLLIQPTGGFSGNIVITITATQPQYVITYSTGLAGWTPTQANVACGGSFTAATPAEGLFVCADGSAFAGWSTNASATSVEYAVGATINPVANMTLYGVWSEGTVSNNYTKITNTSQLEAGADYLVVYTASNVAMKAATYSTGLDKSSVTISSNTITTSDAALIWRLGGTSNAWTLYNASTSKYLSLPSGSVTTLLALADTGTPFTISTTNITSNENTSSYKYVSYHTGSSFFNNYSGNYAVLFKRQASVTYSTTATCTLACADAAVVTLTPTASSINMPASGDATTTIAFSQSGGGAGTWGTPSVTRLSGTGTASVTINGTNIDFSTTGVGEYEVSIAYTQNCAKVGKTTITVLATPVVTIVDVTPLTFTANCGEASVAQSVSVTGYNLTANMTATAPTNFLVSSDNSTYGPSATFTQASGTASGTLYIKANPPAGSTDPISGNVTLASTGATTRTLAVSATVSCTPVTVTFLDWDGTSTVWNTYYSGSTQTLPAPTTGACAGWTFSGWTTNNLTAISAGDIVGTTGANLTLTGSTTYYAVYTQGGGTSTIFSDDFADLTAANSTGVSRTNWSTLTKVYVEASPNNCQFKLGSTKARGIATTVLMSELTGAGTLTFDLQLYGSDANKDVEVTINNGTITTASSAKSSTSNTATYTTSSTKTTHTIALNGGNTTSITFASATTSNNRFYLDNVSVVIGSGTYTLSPACCDINLVKPTVTTSSADKSVTVSWPSVKDAGVEAATAYELTYNLASSSADPTVVPVPATGAASYSQTITGLTNCSNYVFTVEAIGDPNAATTVCSSPIASVTTYPGVAYTVNYQYGAGTGTPNVWVSGCANGTSTTLPAVTPNTLAYVFAGWYDGTTRVGGAGESYTPTADVTLVAQYSAAPTYTLTFVNEGAQILTKTVYSTAVENDRKATEPNANYTDYGLESNPLTTACSEAVFVGWTTTETAAQGTETQPSLVTFPYTISGDATLYALWKITDTEGGGTATDFVKVTSTPSDWSGDYVIVSGTKAMKNTVAAKEMGASDVTISSNTISNPDASIIWTFTNTGTDTYSAYNEAVSKYAYFTGTSSTDAGLSTTAVNLTIGFKEAGNYDQIQLKGSGSYAARCFSYYPASTAWRTYATSNNSTGSLYRRVAGTTTYYSSPQCTAMITVDPADVDNCISAADLEVAVGGTATSTGHTVAARNCSGTSIVPVITGTGRTAFSIDWTSKPLENGRVDAVYTVSYNPLTGSSHSAQLQFKTDDGAVVSSTVNLCGTVCTSALFTTQSSTQSSITFAWSEPLSGASLRVWNDITGSPSCGPMPYDQTTTLGTETSKTISGLSASTTFHYQITKGGCVSEVRNVTTTAAVGLPVLTASPTLWETMAEANRAATYTNTTINLTGANMPDATVTIALRGETAAFTLVPSATIQLVNGAGSIGVTYNPVKPQTNIAYIDLTYTSDCETKTVTITLVGNVPGIDIVEVNPDASGFTLHTDLEGTPNIVLSQEVEHQGSGRQANDLFFSKYFEATQTLKLLGLYNGTKDTISLKGIRIRGQKAGKPSSTSAATWEASTKAKAWSPTEVIGLDTLQSIAPGKEIILFSATSTDNTAINCISGSVGWEHEGWYPVNAATATAVYKDALRNLFITGTYGNTNASIQTGGDRVYTLERKALDGTWESIDLIGAFNGIDSIIGRHVVSTGIVGMDDQGWVCMDGTNYLTKEAAPLSTNRHLLIRKNTVVDGLNALEQNTEDFATLCTEWEGLMVPKNGVGELSEQEITCLHFGQVSTFNYDGYYASFERIDDNLVTFTAAEGRPGDWVGSFLNPTETFQDSLRCYNLKISVERYYDSREVPPLERTKAYVQNLDPTDDAAEIAALDTVEVMSTQYRVPILVMNGENLTTKDLRFTQLSKDTCRTCDVVVMNGGILTKSNLTDDRDSVRSVFVYNGGRLVVPVGLDYSIQDLSIRAQGDAVGAAYVEGNLLMKNPRIYHDKRIDNSKRYFFTLPYNCAVNKITEMNGKSLGVYGTTWIIQYYDGEQRIINRGLSSNWKMVPYDATLQAGRGYIIAITSDVQKYVRFPMVAEATFTEKNTAKTLDVTQYGELQASSGALGYNNVGWNLVGNPYISYFTSDGVSNDGVNNGTVELGGYYMRNSGGFNENTWTRLETSNIYVTIPNSNNVGYTQELASNTQLDPFISFFVQAQATGTLTFATTSRDTSPSLVAASAKRTNETNAVALNLTVGTETDRTTILLDNYHTNAYEVGSDLLKWKDSYAKLPYFYSFGGDNTPLAFNAINYDEAKSTIPVAFYMPTTGARYTFSIDRSRSNLEELEHVYLLRNGSIVADLLFADYTNTNLSRTQENKQFAISIQRAAEVVTPVNPTEDDALMPRAITERHEVRVEQLPAEGTVMVMDAVGRTIATRTLSGTDNMTFELPVDGVYTIKVITPARNYTLKTVIR